ncbi:MAG: hypothetical protein PF517_21975 [Salinivirgaceae bacterium]|jgi:hypothetical protein|nr:hypothetical protein [Salinivirgaceae bacterium]
MELSYYSSAIKTFTSFESKNYTFYTEAGEWYLALCHLKNQDINKSKEILSDIIMRKTSYANEAADLLKKLN